MATGLLQQGMGQPGPGAPAPQGQPPQPEQSPGQPAGDPRLDMDPEQGPQQREQLVGAMLETLYGPMLDQATEMLEQQAEEPEQAIGRIVGHLMLTTYQALSDQNSTAPPGVMVQAGMIASQAVGEIAIRMGLVDEQDGDTIEAGFMVAMAKFGQAAGADMPPEQKQRYRELIEGLRDAKGMSQGAPQDAGAPQGQGEMPPQPQDEMPPEGGM